MLYCMLGENYTLQSNLQSWVFSKVMECVTHTCEGDTRKQMLYSLFPIIHVWFNPETSQPVSCTFSDCTPALWAEIVEMDLQIMSSQPQGTLGPHSQSIMTAMSRKDQERLQEWPKNSDPHLHITKYKRGKRHELGWPHFQRNILVKVEGLGSHFLIKWLNLTFIEYLPCNCHKSSCQTLYITHKNCPKNLWGQYFSLKEQKYPNHSSN